MEAIIRSAVGASQVSPPRKRWDNGTKKSTGLPDCGLMLVIVGGFGTLTVNQAPLLSRPETVTTTYPVVAPLGTDVTMLVLLQFVGVAAVPLNVTVLVPWLVPKLVPVIVIASPTPPFALLRLVMVGAVPPPPALAALNAARAAPPGSEALSASLAAATPAAVCTSACATSFVFGSAGTKSLVKQLLGSVKFRSSPAEIPLINKSPLAPVVPLLL